MLFTKRCLVVGGALALLAVSVRADITARWELHADFDDRRIPGASGDCTFRQDGERLSGRCEDATLTGEIKGETVTWRLTPAGTHDSMIFTGMLDDDDTVIVGRFTYPGKGSGSFLAVKRKSPLSPHALLSGHLAFAGGIARRVVSLDLTLSLVMADEDGFGRRS
jgi:hypothetical protein